MYSYVNKIVSKDKRKRLQTERENGTFNRIASQPSYNCVHRCQKMEERGQVILSSNWNTLGDVDLKRILVNSFNCLDIEIEDLEVGNCVCLIQNKSNGKSKAELEIKTKGYITDVVLLSEAQVIEVFGENDEYLLTSNAEFFDDWEEMAVYYTKISLPNIPICKLKFTRSKCKSRLWIYGVKVIIKNRNEELTSPVQFNLEQIKRLIGSSSNGSQNNFRNVCHFLENLTCSNGAYTLGKKLGRNDYNNYMTDIICHDKNKENCLEEILSRLNINGAGSSGSKKINLKEATGESSSNLILAYINEKCQEIKSDILHEVDRKLNSWREETNHKLNKIISLLENEN